MRWWRNKAKMANAYSPVSDDRIPVIVGVGEIADHPAELTAGLEPLALLEAAVRRAAEDAAAPLLGEIDSLDVVNFLSWRYRDPEQLLAARLGIKPSHCYLRSGRRRKPDPLSARSGAAHRARRNQSRRGLRRGGAIDRDQGRARQSHAAVDAVRARRARAEARRGVPEADGGDARRVPADHGLSALRSGHLSALGPDAARSAGGIRRAVVALFGSRGRQSAILDEARGIAPTRSRRPRPTIG